MSESKMNMLTFYSEILALGNLYSDSDGFISLKSGDKQLPVNLSFGKEKEAKRLVLPTRENLMNSGEGNYIFFHPLRENIVRGESEVITFFRKAVNIKIINTACLLIEHILRLASSPELQTKLTAQQTSLMSIVKDADEKTLDLWEKLKSKVTYDNSKSRLYSIYLRKHGKLNDKSYFCLGVVTFPFYEVLEKTIAENKTSKDILGLKCRKKDLEILQNILRELVPNIDEASLHYKQGSNDKQASFLMALLASVEKLTTELNRLTDILFKGRSPLPKAEKDALYESLYFPLEWADLIDNTSEIEKEILLVPPQKWNEGREAKSNNGANVDETEEDDVETQSSNHVLSKPPTPRRFETIEKPIVQKTESVYNRTPSVFNNQNHVDKPFNEVVNERSARPKDEINVLDLLPKQTNNQLFQNPNNNRYNNGGVFNQPQNQNPFFSNGNHRSIFDDQPPF
jgi:hypothetical protein